MGLLQRRSAHAEQNLVLTEEFPLAGRTLAATENRPLLQRIQSRLQNIPVVIVPGLRNSDERHWQSAWQNLLPGSQRIEVADWHIAELEKWRNAILKTLTSLEQPALLIAHSFGSLASASIAHDYPSLVRGALLVAPAAPQKFGIEAKLPQSEIARPLHLIGSDSDPWLGEQQAEQLAKDWGAAYHRTIGKGHINSESQLGVWSEGLIQLEKFLNTIEQTHYQ
jgi:predicted alpha/beta hydrolase family esterase